MFKKKDYIKKKYKDVPKLNIGDVNRLLQSTKDDNDRFRMFTSLLEVKQQEQQQQVCISTEEILQNNVKRLVELYGDQDINQEALNNIYQSIEQDDNVEQSITQMELQNIPLVDQSIMVTDVQHKINKYEHYLIVLQTKMAKNIFSNYGIYLEALETIDDINDISTFSLEKVKHIRKQIQIAQQEISKKGQSILQKRSMIINLQSTIQQIKQIQLLYKEPYDLYIKSINDGYIDAEHYITLLKSIGTIQYDMIPQNYVMQRINFTINLTKKGIIQQLVSFKEEIYAIHFKSFHFLEQNKYIPSFKEEINSLILQAYDIKLQSVLQALSEILQIDFYFENLADSLQQIPKDQLVEFYRELNCQTIEFLLNLHLVQRYHLNTNTELQQLMLDLRKSIVDNLLLKYEEIFQLTTQWIRMKKEDMICLFGMMGIFVAKCENYNGQSQKRFKDFLKSKFKQFLQTRGNDKLIRDFVLNEDCKKCLKIKLNQTQMLIQMASQIKNQIFDFQDPFPEILNIYKPIEFRRIIDLYFNTVQHFKKQPQIPTIIYNGKERNILLTYTVNQLYYFLQQYLLYIIFCKEEQQMLIKEFSYLVNYYIYQVFLSMISDNLKKVIFEKDVNLEYDVKADPENYITQFDFSSEIILFRNNHPELYKFITEMTIPEELEITKTETYELSERVVFVESLIFLIAEFKEIIGIIPQFNEMFMQLMTMIPSIQNLVLKSAIPDLTSPLLNVKYEIKQNDKEDPIRGQVIEKIHSYFTQLRIQELSAIQQQEFQKIIADGILYQYIETLAKIKKINNLGREAMIQDYQSICKIVNFENTNYEQYLRIFNQIQSDIILEYIYENQGLFQFKILHALFHSQVLLAMKKQSKKESLQKMFQTYKL